MISSGLNRCAFFGFVRLGRFLALGGLLLGGCCLLLSSVNAASVQWAGGGGSTSWHVAANWSTKSVPGTADDVTLGAGVIVVFESGSTSIRSLQSAGTLRITGGSLRVTAGGSAVSGPLELVEGSLEAAGTNTVFTASGPVTHSGTGLRAVGGASIIMPQLTSLVESQSGDLNLTADGANSLIQLLGVTSSRVLDYYQLELDATAGGRIRIPGLLQFTGGLDIYADGAGSRVELPGLAGVVRDASSATSRIEVGAGSTVDLPNVTGLERFEVIVHGDGSLPLDRLKTFRLGSLRMTGGVRSLPGLTNVLGTDIFLGGGAQLTLPGVTQVGRTNSSDVRLHVSDAGSLLDLPAMVGSAVLDYYQLELYAYGGGRIRLPVMSRFTGGVDIYAIGLGSRVELPGLAGVLRDSSPSSSNIEVRDGAVVDVPNITGLEHFEVILKGDGGFPLDRLRSINLGSLQLVGMTKVLPGLTNAIGANITLSEGAQLTLAGLTQVGRTNSGDLTFRVSNPGSRLSLPNAVSSSVSDYYQLELFSYSGGLIEMPALTSFRGSMDLYADGADSLVDLPSLRGVVTDVSAGRSSIESRGGGRVRMLAATGLRRFDVFLGGTGEFGLEQLGSFIDGGLRLSGTSRSLPGLTNITDSSVGVEGGAQLTLAGITSITNSNSRSLTFTARGSGSVLRLPAVTSGGARSGYQLELFAYDGARIEFPGLTSFAAGLDLYAEGAGSLVDLSGWRGGYATPLGASTAIETRSGGSIAIPGMTALDRVTLHIRGPGTVSTAQLNSLTHSTVTIDGVAAQFGILSDTTGTTFEYLNGGTAVFPRPADFIVSDIRAPATVDAPRAAALEWEITNRGSPVEQGVWSDSVYLSSDATVGGDVLLGVFPSSGSFPAGGSMRFTNSVVLPASRAGTWRVVVVANENRLVFEGTNTANNAAIASTTTVIRAPDLAVDSLALEPANAVLGQPATVRWRVRNLGTSAAPAGWLERLSLGSSVVLSTNAPVVLAPGASESRAALVVLPLTPGMAAGSQVLSAIVDLRDVVAESDESNNSASANVTVALPPLPNLRPIAFDLPAEALTGVSIPVSWAVTNRGAAAARAPWNEVLRLVSVGGAARTFSILTQPVTNDLAVGASMVRNRLVSFPEYLVAGEYAASVTVDVDGEVYEGDEADNQFVAVRHLVVPAILTWRLATTSIAENATPPTIDALLVRNGDPAPALAVALSGSLPSQLSLPASVTFPAGQSSVPITLTVHADGIPDSDRTATLTATALGYRAGTIGVTVRNTDLPHLQLRFAAGSVVEGQTLAATVSRDGGISAGLGVAVTVQGGGQLVVPPVITIPAGQSETTFVVIANDDTLVEPARVASAEVAAPGYVGASASVTITDNDLPQFVLSLATTSVSENAGASATTATISRGLPGARSLAVELENSNPSAVHFPPSVVIPAGSASVSFPVAVTDNAIVDGARTAVLRAFALATASETRVAASDPVTLSVLDDDGPALFVSIARDVVAEGLANATVVTVSRNTPSAVPLSVALSSSDAGEATVPSGVTIPSGQASATVPLTTIEDLIPDGNQRVQVTASAAGYIPGSAWVTVTDLTRPDLVVGSVTGPDSAETEAFVNVAYRVTNQGLAPAGTNWLTRVLLSQDAAAGDDTLVAEYRFGGTLPVGEYFAQSRQVRLPTQPGDYWVVVVTDVENQIDEVLESNNTTVSAKAIHVDAAYRATVKASPASAPAGTPIVLSGTAVRTSTGGPVPFVLVNIHIGVRGMHRVISAITDDLGRFSTTFQPLPGEAGVYEVGAAHPGALSSAVQDSFILHGLKATTPELLTVKLTERSSVTVQIPLENLGDAALTGLAVTVVSNLPNVQVTPTLGGTNVAGLGRATLGFAITAGANSAGAGDIVLRVTSLEGARLDVPVAVSIASFLPSLDVRPRSLIGGVRPGSQALLEFEVVNTGGSASAPIHVALPSNLPWLRCATPNPMPALAPGATNRVTLQLRPDASVPLGSNEGALILSAGDVSASVPFEFRVLSDARGDLVVSTVDEYTYYAEGAPKLAGAEVTILDAVSELVITNGITDADGGFVVRQLPEGWYDVRVRADNHTPYRGTGLVVAGFQTNMLAFLSRQAVKYLWTVVPTEVQDRTRITIETVFEAFVPMPVVTIDPAVIDLADYTADVTQIELRISNHGLVAAQKAQVHFGTHPDWSLEPLIEQLGTLPARSTLTVPMLIRRLGHGGGSPASRSGATLARASLQGGGGGGCSIGGGMKFEIPCGGGSIGGGAGVAVVNAGSGCGGGGGGGFPGGGGGGGGGGSSSGGGNAGSSASVRSCDPCLLAILSCLLEVVLPGALDCAKDLYGCAKHGNEPLSTDSAWDCTKAGLTCAEALGAELSRLNTAIDIIECAQDLAKSCGASPGGGGGGGGAGGGGGGGAGGGDNGGGGARASLQSSRLASNSGTVGTSTTSGGSTLVTSTVERAELTILRQRAAWLTAEMAPVRYLLGNDAWCGDPKPAGAQVFLRAFLNRIEPGTAAGIRISSDEAASLLGTPVPASVTPQVIHAFIDRWNRSVDYWQANIFNAAQLAPGQNTDFLDMGVLRDLARGQIEADAECVGAGFRSPSDAFNRASADLMRFLGEGDGGGVCAHVRIQLEQELVSTRDAFNATLEIENALTDPLENVSVEVIVRHRTGESANAVFAIPAPQLTGLTAANGTGTLAGGATGKVRWLLVPTPDAATDGPQEYLVGGLLRYRQGLLNVTVPLAPATITVQPSPSLAVKYFHQRDVFADDPFTTEVEPSIPYSLAVMVENRGNGTARKVHIASAQPKIVDNEKGLLADFKIIATEVAGKNLEPSLTVDFGTINPHTNAIGRWLMTSTILGGFLEYKATVEHQDELGDKRLALVEGVEIHELLHIVRATGARDDGRPDFLVNDVADLLDYPDTLHLSDGSREPVAVVLQGSFDAPPATDRLEVNLTASVPPGWVYLRLPDPANGRFKLARVTRSDGVEVPFGENAWTTDRTFLGNARRPVVENTVHLFDGNSTGRYKLVYAVLPGRDEVPPVSRVNALPAESTTLFPVTWGGEDNAGGSGISFYAVYAAVDGGSFSLWQMETLDRSAIYQGAVGHSYAFYSVATDIAGNRGTAPSTPDATTRVTHGNRAPTLAPILDQSIREGSTLVVQAVAIDPDGDSLVYSLEGIAPPGVTIQPYTGRITWTTGAGNGPATYPLTVQVLDTGLPRLGAVRTFRVGVSDENVAPILDAIADRAIREGQLLAITNRATDPDRPAQALTFSLGAGAPSGAVIDPATGVLRWQPSASQGGSTYRLEIVVRDSGTPSLSASRVFRVAVSDTRADFVVDLGTTNLVAGGAASLPILLTSDSSLAQVGFEVQIDAGHLGGFTLEPVDSEVVLAAFESIGSGRYRVQLDLAAVGLVERTRNVANLRFQTGVLGHSAVEHLGVGTMVGMRRDGEATHNALNRPGRVFVLEGEPLVDAAPMVNGHLGLTVFGQPGRSYRLQRSTGVGAAATWSDQQSIQLIDRTGTLELTPDIAGAGFFRVLKP